MMNSYRHGIMEILPSAYIHSWSFLMASIKVIIQKRIKYPQVSSALLIFLTSRKKKKRIEKFKLWTTGALPSETGLHVESSLNATWTMVSVLPWRQNSLFAHFWIPKD